ncbi:MAG: hypothetical protein HZC36_00760 [Armatimonadetes bacterium]|nr:hypothetical protein [Armatimonadota bacterium]
MKATAHAERRLSSLDAIRQQARAAVEKEERKRRQVRAVYLNLLGAISGIPLRLKHGPSNVTGYLVTRKQRFKVGLARAVPPGAGRMGRLRLRRTAMLRGVPSTPSANMKP